MLRSQKPLHGFYRGLCQNACRGHKRNNMLTVSMGIDPWRSARLREGWHGLIELYDQGTNLQTDSMLEEVTVKDSPAIGLAPWCTTPHLIILLAVLTNSKLVEGIPIKMTGAPHHQFPEVRTAHNWSPKLKCTLIHVKPSPCTHDTWSLRMQPVDTSSLRLPLMILDHLRLWPPIYSATFSFELQYHLRKVIRIL